MYHTTALKDTDIDETLGYAKFHIWNARPEYDSFDVDPKTWMHVGTSIANEMASTEEEAMSIWRDYQYQLYYHLSQRMAKTWKKENIFYAGISFIEKKYRNRPDNILTMSQSIMFTSMPKNFCTIFLVSYFIYLYFYVQALSSHWFISDHSSPAQRNNASNHRRNQHPRIWLHSLRQHCPEMGRKISI